ARPRCARPRPPPGDRSRLRRRTGGGKGGPATACDRVRALMARQLTRHRIASAFQHPVKVAAKSGSLFGIVRNEIGVISYPDGCQYAAAVVTRSHPGSDDAAISRAIGTATAQTITALRPPAT